MNESQLKTQIELAAKGDRSATAQLLVHFGPDLLRRVEAKMQQNRFPELTADDVLQEVYVDVFKGISSFDTSSGIPFVAWLYRVTDNRFAQTMRDRGRKKRGGHVWHVDNDQSSIVRLINDIGDDNNETPSKIVANDEAAQELKLCVAALPEHQRDAINRFYLEEQKLDEIAKEMNTTKDALRGLIYRARTTIRSMMGTSSMWFTKKT